MIPRKFNMINKIIVNNKCCCEKGGKNKPKMPILRTHKEIQKNERANIGEPGINSNNPVFDSLGILDFDISISSADIYRNISINLYSLWTLFLSAF